MSTKRIILVSVGVPQRKEMIVLGRRLPLVIGFGTRKRSFVKQFDVPERLWIFGRRVFGEKRVLALGKNGTMRGTDALEKSMKDLTRSE